MLKTMSDIDEARKGNSKQVLSADTLIEIGAAKQVLRERMKAHPEEQGMRWGFEQLYTIQEIVESEEAERGHSNQRPVVARQAA